MNFKNPNLPLTYFAGTHTGNDIFIGHCKCWMAQTSSFEQDLLASWNINKNVINKIKGKLLWDFFLELCVHWINVSVIKTKRIMIRIQISGKFFLNILYIFFVFSQCLKNVKASMIFKLFYFIRNTECHDLWDVSNCKCTYFTLSLGSWTNVQAAWFRHL